MITSIVLTGKYNIGISTSNKIKLPNGVIVDVKDIPFVRYRFDTYGDNEFDFIKANKKKFPCVHLMEITLDENTESVLNRVEEENLNIATMVYVPVGDNEVLHGLSDGTIDLLEAVGDCEFDRINIKDVSTSLYNLKVEEFKKDIADAVGVNANKVGVCGGPCCFIDGNACLTAVKARELLAKYSDIDNPVVPSANHEGSLDKLDTAVGCVNRCGCIRYHVFNADSEAPASKMAKAPKKESEPNVKAEPKEKKPKVVKPKGYVITNW